jgi:hypothetical protein
MEIYFPSTANESVHTNRSNSGPWPLRRVTFDLTVRRLWIRLGRRIYWGIISILLELINDCQINW